MGGGEAEEWLLVVSIDLKKKKKKMNGIKSILILLL